MAKTSPFVWESCSSDINISHAGGFSELELRVIALAQHRNEYHEQAAPFSWSALLNYVNNLVGNGQPQRLASDQLESLRCLVSELRFRPNGPRVDTVTTFLGTGYSLAMFDILRRNIPHYRDEDAQRRSVFDQSN